MNLVPSYLCRGQFATWRIPGTKPGGKLVPYSYSDNLDGTIFDNITGLVWQKVDDGTARTWDSALTYCSEIALPGAGWRLPTKIELESLFDPLRRSSEAPAIDPIFVGARPAVYWTASDEAATLGEAWAVHFGSTNAHVDSYPTEDAYFARCVRGETVVGSGPTPYGTVTDEIVVDNRTGLTWQRNVPIHPTNCSFFDGTQCSFDEAQHYCAGLSLGGTLGWRLPSPKEALSLFDPIFVNEALTPSVIPDLRATIWTQTTAKGAWRVGGGVFVGQFQSLQGVPATSGVRCVR